MTEELKALFGKPKSYPDELDSAKLLTGGLRTVRSGLSMVLEQARQLSAAGLIADEEVRRLECLAGQFDDLLFEYYNGLFMADLGRLLEDLRRR